MAKGKVVFVVGGGVVCKITEAGVKPAVTIAEKADREADI